MSEEPKKPSGIASGGLFAAADPYLFFVAAAAGNIFAASCVALTAVCPINLIADIDRMNEIFHCLSGRDVFLFLAEDGMAEIAVFGDNFSLGRLVLAIMAAETPRCVEMTDVVRIGIPGHLHFREEITAVNGLNFLNRFVNGRGLICGYLRVVFIIVVVESGGNCVLASAAVL